MRSNSLKCTTHLLLSSGLLSIAALLFLGCAVAGPVGVSMAVGTVYLNKEPAQIQVTEDEMDVKDCLFIKHVKASTLWGGLAFQDKALEKTISDLTHESVVAGANLLLIRKKNKSFNGSYAEGDAYCCPVDDNTSTSSKGQPRNKPIEKGGNEL